MTTDLAQPRRLWIDPLIVFAVTVTVFAPVIWTQFSVVDDYLMLVSNPMLDPPSWAGFKHQLTTPQYNLYSPLTYGMLYVLGAIAGPGLSMSPVPFKVASLLVHGLSSMAAWWCLWQLCGRRRAAVIGALVVGLHPLQVESVAWATGLKDLLCGGLSFLTIGLYLHWIQTRRSRSWRLAVVTAILAMLAKPTATVLPLTLGVIDLILRDATWEDRLRRLWPFALAAAASAAVILNVQTGAGIERPPAWARPLVAADAYAFYMGKLVWPVQLAIDYARTPHAIIRSGAIYWTWIFSTLVFAGLIATRIRSVWVACALFVIPILPVSGIITFDMQDKTTVTDHYMYQPMLGVGLLVATMVGCRRVVAAAMVGVLAALSAVSVMRLSDWRDVRGMIIDNIQHYPRARLAWDVLPQIELLRGDPRAAERAAYLSLQRSNNELIFDTLAHALLEQGRYQQAAIAARKCLMRDNQLPMRRVHQMFALAARPDVNDEALARLAVLKWITLEPRNPAPRQLLQQIDASIARKATTQPSTRRTETHD
jgi:protein O-mannosyl-transferase